MMFKKPKEEVLASIKVHAMNNVIDKLNCYNHQSMVDSIAYAIAFAIEQALLEYNDSIYTHDDFERDMDLK